MGRPIFKQAELLQGERGSCPELSL